MAARYGNVDVVGYLCSIRANPDLADRVKTLTCSHIHRKIKRYNYVIVLFASHIFRNRKLHCIVLLGTAIPQLPEHSVRLAAVSTQRTERARVHC